MGTSLSTRVVRGPAWRRAGTDSPDLATELPRIALRQQESRRRGATRRAVPWARRRLDRIAANGPSIFLGCRRRRIRRRTGSCTAAAVIASRRRLRTCRRWFIRIASLRARSGLIHGPRLCNAASEAHAVITSCLGAAVEITLGASGHRRETKRNSNENCGVELTHTAPPFVKETAIMADEAE